MTSTKLELRDRTALITGGAGGIGAAVASQLASGGTNIVLTDVSQASLDQTAAGIGGGRVLAIAADVTDAAAMRAVVDRTVEQFGRLDVVFANAGIGPKPPSTMLTTDPAMFEKIVEVDLLGVWRTIQPALTQIVANHGHILITGSIYSFLNGMVNGPYAASKAGVEQLGRALRSELAMHGAPQAFSTPAGSRPR